MKPSSNHHIRSIFVIFVVFVFIASLLDFLGSLSYYFNFEGKNIFIPYYSDRNVLPFPLLFKEFDLSNKDSIRSTVKRNRGADEPCTRRILTEYENYRLNNDQIFHNVPKKGFVAPRDSPPGWLSYTPVDKLILNLLDGYRFDYVVEDPLLDSESKDVRNIFTNKMTKFYDLMKSPKSQYYYRLYKLISFYPTLTTFAVKGILSGDTRNVGMISDNRNPSDLKLDHSLHQFHSNNMKLNLIGDVTAYDLAPDSFDNHITNKHKNTVNDIYNADKMVYDNFKNYVDNSDVLLLHLVGADHLSHCGGRNTDEMTNIMNNYNIFVKDLMNEYQRHNNYMIMFFGDHGQKESGTHGDDSIEEMETFLLVYTDVKLRDSKLDYCPVSETPVAYRLNHSALNGKVQPGYKYGRQNTMDICTTACLLTNVPVPFHSEGSIISTSIPLILDKKGNTDLNLSEKYMVQLHHVNVHHHLRIVDILSQNPEVKLNVKMYNKILSKRLELVNLYTLLRLVDTSKRSNFVKVNQLYHDYVTLCNKLSELSTQLIKESTRTFTFHYLYISIIVKYVAIVILVFCTVGTLRYYLMGKHISDAEWDKKIDDTIVKKIMKRMLTSVFVSLFLSLLLGCNFKAILNLYFFKLNISWPLGLFKYFHHLSLYYTHFFSKFFLIEEFNLYLHFSVLYMTFLTIFFLCSLPLLYSSLRFFYSDSVLEEKKKFVSYPSPLKTFCHNMGLFELRNLTTPLFCLIFILVITSECALYSHDSISRHMLVIFMLIESVPFLLNNLESNLSQKIKRNLFFLFALSKLSSFLHDYRLFFFSSDLPSASWLRMEKFLSLFEVGAFSLTVYYYLLMKFFLKFTKADLNDSKDHFEFSIISCARALKRKRLMITIYTLSYVFTLVNYALTTQSSLLGLNNFIHNLHNAYNMKMFVSCLFARAVLLLFLFSAVLLISNPKKLFYDPNHSYKFSSFILYTVPNFGFLIFLICGQKKSLQNLLGFLIMYHCCVILICKNSNLYLSHAILFQTLGDTIYFTNGCIDKYLTLNLQTAFVFVNNYIPLISDTTVLFDVISTHVLVGMLLMFIYFNCTSIKYDLLEDMHSIESGLGSFDLVTSDKFKSYLNTSINEGCSLEPKPNEVSRKTFTLMKIVHVVTRFILLISVLSFSILTIIMKVHYIPCIAFHSFPKALFLLIKSTSVFGTQLFLFTLRALV